MESTISFCSQLLLLLLMVTERFLSKPILSKQALLLILHTIKPAVQDISTSMNLQVEMLEIICQLLIAVNTYTNKMHCKSLDIKVSFKYINVNIHYYHCTGGEYK